MAITVTALRFREGGLTAGTSALYIESNVPDVKVDFVYGNGVVATPEDGIIPVKASVDFRRWPGPANFRFRKDGYKPLDVSWSEEDLSGNAWDFDVFMEEEAPKPISIIYLRSVPSGARVYFDGVYKHTTPFGMQATALSYHDLRFELEGYVTREMLDVRWPSIGSKEMELVLNPVPLPPGYVRGTVTDSILHLPLAPVSVKFAGYSTITISEGKYNLEVPIGSSGPITFSLPGYETYEKMITCGPGINVDLDVGLVFIPPLYPKEVCR